MGTRDTQRPKVDERGVSKGRHEGFSEVSILKVLPKCLKPRKIPALQVDGAAIRLTPPFSG